MRVTTAFNRILRLPGASVKDVAFGGEGVIVEEGPPQKLLRHPTKQRTSAFLTSFRNRSSGTELSSS